MSEFRVYGITILFAKTVLPNAIWILRVITMNRLPNVADNSLRHMVRSSGGDTYGYMMRWRNKSSVGVVTPPLKYYCSANRARVTLPHTIPFPFDWVSLTWRADTIPCGAFVPKQTLLSCAHRVRFRPSLVDHTTLRTECASAPRCSWLIIRDCAPSTLPPLAG